MISPPNNPPLITADAIPYSTTITATGVRINDQLNDLVETAYDSTKNCESFLFSIPTNGNKYIQSILAMNHPLDEETQKRLVSLANNKIVMKSQVRLTNTHYSQEVLRRAQWLKLLNVKPKSWKNHQCITWLNENKLTASENIFVRSKLESYLKEKEQLREDNVQLASANEKFSKNHRKKFRLFHAFFHERFRDSLLKLYLSKDKRQQLDAQNTVAAPPSLFEEVTELYNDPNWVPHTFLFPDFDSRFRTATPLPLEKENGEYDTKTPENAKYIFNDTRADYKKIYAKWKTSGNGSGNKNPESGDAEPDLVLRINGTTYESNVNIGDSLKYVEDDRANFCQKVGIYVGYFWCMTEMCGVCQFMTQDCSGIGLSSTSKYISLKDRYNNVNKKKRERKSKQEKALEQLDKLLNGVDSMVKKQKHDHDQQLGSVLGSTLKKELRDAESDLLSFQEREETCYETFRVESKEGSQDVRYVQILKKRLENLEKEVVEKEKIVKSCKRKLAKWEMAENNKKTKRKKNKDELIRHIVASPPSVHQPRRAVTATTSTTESVSTVSATEVFVDILQEKNDSSGDELERQTREALDSSSSSSCSDGEDDCDIFEIV